jgi:hypothetical protein
LFKNAGPSREYLENLKTLFTPENWTAERNNLIAWLKKQKINWFLFELYSNEKMYPQLFTLLKNEPYWGNLQKYGKVLMNDYGEEILLMHSTAVQRTAETANTRKKYRELVDDLKSIKKLKGGNALVKQLVTRFRQAYKKRPAMMEELSVFK